MSRGLAYDGNTIVVDVCSLVEFFLELSVLLLWPRQGVSIVQTTTRPANLLDTTGVQGGLVNAVGNHGDG